MRHCLTRDGRQRRFSQDRVLRRVGGFRRRARLERMEAGHRAAAHDARGHRVRVRRGLLRRIECRARLCVPEVSAADHKNHRRRGGGARDISRRPRLAALAVQAHRGSAEGQRPPELWDARGDSRRSVWNVHVPDHDRSRARDRHGCESADGRPCAGETDPECPSSTRSRAAGAEFCKAQGRAGRRRVREISQTIRGVIHDPCVRDDCEDRHHGIASRGGGSVPVVSRCREARAASEAGRGEE